MKEMVFDIKFVRSLFTAGDYKKGRDYYQSGRVGELKSVSSDEIVTYTCKVRGTKRYSVSFSLQEEDGQTYVDMDCTCPRFADRGECKHVAAAMLKAALDSPESAGDLSEAIFPDWRDGKPKQTAGTPLENRPGSSLTDQPARRLMEQYINLSRSADKTGEAHLTPALSPVLLDGEYPKLSLTVGVARMYVVKDISTFLDNVAQRRTVAYGKNLTLFHGLENFDAPSRALIELLMDECPRFHAVQPGRYYYASYSAAYGMKGDSIKLEGSSFDRLFDILRDFPAERGGGRFRDGDPEVTLSLSGNGRAVKLSVDAPGELHFFGSKTRLYADMGRQLLRCGDGFRERVYPLLADGVRVMSVSPEDMPVFCGYVLPKLRGLVTVEDAEGIAEKYLPDECVPRFYFDLDSDGAALTLDVRFRYGETEVVHDGFSDSRTTPRRDAPAETGTLDFAGRLFSDGDGAGHFRLFGDDAIYDFLTAGMDAFFERGEVFISDRLRGRRLQSAPAGVGISVSDGTLLLDIDTGEFPASELV